MRGSARKSTPTCTTPIKLLLPRATYDPRGWTSRVVIFTPRKPTVLPLLEERRARKGL